MAGNCSANGRLKMKAFLAAAIFTTLLIGVLMAQRSEDGAQNDSWTLSVDKDRGKEEQSVSLRDPKTVTVCSDGRNPILLSVDGKHWHEVANIGDSCVQAPAARFVKLAASQNNASTAEVYATY
jgi:hypothetical protein